MKHVFQRHLPDYNTIRHHPSLKFLGEHLHDPNLWHLNRTAVARAVAIGIFTAFLPVPFQMVIAAILAIFFRANLTISVVAVWITNPITMPPIFFFCYKVGRSLWPYNLPHFAPQNSLSAFITHFYLVWKPMLIGCLLVGSIASLLAYTSIRLLWTITVIRRFRLRKHVKSAPIV